MTAVGLGAITLSQIEGWDTEHLESAARAWDATAQHWEDTFTAVHRGSLHPGGTDWEGEGAEAAQQRTFADLVKVRGFTDHLYDAARIARRGADHLDYLKRATLDAIDEARTAGFDVGEDLSLSDRSLVPLGPAFAARQAQAEHLAIEIHIRAGALSAANQEIGAQITAAIAPLSGAKFDEAPGEEKSTVQAVDYKKSPADSMDEPQPFDTGSDIPVGKSPAEVKRWWDGLSQERRDQLLRGWPERMGALDGIPVVDRSTANVAVMQRDIDRVGEVAEARGVTPEEVLAHPDRFGMAGPMLDRYQNGLKARDALRATSTKAGATSYLQVYQPEAFGGDGRAAIAIGDPDHAANTAVVVPGTGNSVRKGWQAQDDAINLYDAMFRADSSKPSAVVAWMGYDTPDSLIERPRVSCTLGYWCASVFAVARSA